MSRPDDQAPFDYLRDQGITDAAVLAAMNRVPRAEFVRESDRADALRNRPLPIGHGQTISQPYVVAFMTSALGLRRGDRVLEVGTGSGYQAAILAELGCEVCTIEAVPALCESARLRLDRLGYQSIRTRCGNGRDGWQDLAPFQAILVAAADVEVPPALPPQLADGGRLIMPVGSPAVAQELILLTRNGSRYRSETLLPVRFVPLTDSNP